MKEFHANTLVEVNLDGPPHGRAQAAQTRSAMALFHICQEALANVAKHARARHVDVALWTTPERVLLEVSDDGRGFDPDARQNDPRPRPVQHANPRPQRGRRRGNYLRTRRGHHHPGLGARSP